ncbi:MAG: hypothetical protein ACREKQ_01485 [Candidatus Rokuibacteriota bacterium]
MRIREILADHYRIPLPVALSDSTHGVIEGFELVTARLRDEDVRPGPAAHRPLPDWELLTQDDE